MIYKYVTGKKEDIKMNSELLKNKRVILKDGSIAYRLTTKIRIVNGKITNHYDSDIKQITPQILNQVKKTISNI